MEERRQDYPKILSSVEEIKISMAKIATLMEERNTTAIEWRNSVCDKFKDMKSYCAKRQDAKIKVVIAIIVILAAALVGWGENKRQIDVNTDRLTKLEAWQVTHKEK